MITFNDKVTLVDQPDVADENKVTASNMNEIKTQVNNSFTYSTTEINTGKIWTDNKPIYRAIIVVDPYTSGGNVNINELNIENITNFQALRKYNNQTDINYYNNSNDFFRALVRKYNNQFVITLQGSNSGQAKVEIILEYTKAN